MVKPSEVPEELVRTFEKAYAEAVYSPVGENRAGLAAVLTEIGYEVPMEPLPSEPAAIWAQYKNSHGQTVEGLFVSYGGKHWVNGVGTVHSNSITGWRYFTPPEDQT